MSGDNLNITLVADQNGAGTVTVRATDTAGAFVDANVPVTVNPVNDDPYVVTPIADVGVSEDASAIVVDVSPAFDDVDIGTNGDALTYSLVSVSNGALFAAGVVAYAVMGPMTMLSETSSMAQLRP